MPTKLGEVLGRASVPDSGRARTAFLRRLPEDTPPSRRRSTPWSPQPQRRILAILATAIAAAAAILLAIALKPGAGQAPSGPLASLAATAYAQELAGPFEYVEWRYDLRSGNAIDRRIETWAGANERFERRTFSVAGKPAGHDTTYVNREANVSCDGTPGRPPDCGEFEVGPDLSAAALWFEAPELPTEPSELKATLEDEIATEYEAGISAGTPTIGNADGVSGFGPAGPLEDVRPGIREAIIARSLFSKLVGVVSNPYASPELRGAAYEVMGGIAEVSVHPGATDGEGRAATRINFVAPDPFRGRRGSGERYALYVDPATSLVLQLDVDEAGTTKAVETVIKRRTTAELPVGAERFRASAARFAPPPPPVALPPADSGPPVSLASGPDWEVAITDDRAIVLTSQNGKSRQSTSGFANPPTLSEFGSFRAAGSPRKVLAGPVSEHAASVQLTLANGTTVEAELVDAFDLRWAWAEVRHGARVVSIMVRGADGSVLARRNGRHVVDE